MNEITRITDLKEVVIYFKKTYELSDYEALKIITRLQHNRILEDSFGAEVPRAGKPFLEQIGMNGIK